MTQTAPRNRHAANDTSRRTAGTVDANPLTILAGGIALGAVVGALLPRSDREKELLAPLGRELGARARAATDAARDAGQTELAELGLTRGAARDQVKSLLKGVVKAVGTAGSVAAKTASTKS